MPRRPRRRRCAPAGLQVTSTATTWSRAGVDRIGDLERVADEVAVGVAEVVAVEPHVALGEEAVEFEPDPSAALGARRRTSTASAVERTNGGTAPWWRRRDRRSRSSDPAPRDRARPSRRSRAGGSCVAILRRRARHARTAELHRPNLPRGPWRRCSGHGENVPTTVTPALMSSSISAQVGLLSVSARHALGDPKGGEPQ